MDSNKAKHLVFGFLGFLDRQITSSELDAAAKESLEVAAQCLQSAYGLNLQDENASALYPLPGPLEDVFTAALEKLKMPQLSTADKEMAEKLKNEGNELLRQEKVPEAINSYSKAIAIDGRNAVYYSNRAAAHSKMGDHQKCIGDCLKALELDPNYSKAYGRKGLAHTALGQHREAQECFRRALELDPANDGYRENLHLAEQSLKEQGSTFSSPGGGVPNFGGLNLSQLLNNPALMSMATSMMANPHVQTMMANMVSTASGAPNPMEPAAMSNLLQAGQQLAQEMQASNPELVEQLRAQMRDQNSPPNDHDKTINED